MPLLPFLKRTLLALACLLCLQDLALASVSWRDIASGETDARVAALRAALLESNPRLAPFVEALLEDRVRVSPAGVWVIDGEAVRDFGADLAAVLPADAEDVSNNNRMRRELGVALAVLQLRSPRLAQRQAAVQVLQEQADNKHQAMIEQAWLHESDEPLKAQLQTLRASLLLAAPLASDRALAAKWLAAQGSPKVSALLDARLAVEPDAAVRAQLALAAGQVKSQLAWGERLGLLFAGLSLGSILLLAALGLAITYGLMGVINMAHGELIMVGAYATYLVQQGFKAWLPGLFDYYLLLAVPMAFLATAGVGAMLERTVVRWLYGRPLETLLATFGISLVLMQAVRSLFGAQNVAVENPAWLSGGWAVMSNLTLPFNRLAITVFAALVLGAVAWAIARTRLGLFVRGVTQNRAMASCMGVHTARIDTLAFALGSGIAGLAGCALSQVGNVGPDLGQAYIVDSFLVVVTGGVGQLAGTVWAAMGLGLINKGLEGWAGAVLAKIIVLVAVVAFIQKRPSGLFALKGRSAEA
jgi:urea transport system permease protein